MSRREEKRRGARKRRRERHVDSDVGDDVVSRSRYETRPSRRPEDRRDRDMYDYSAFEDRYFGWQDLYRPDYYRGDRYNDYGRSYGSFNRGYDYDFYDDYRPSYGYDSGGAGCRACNRNGIRGDRWGDDPYIYQYEEAPRPRHRRSPESGRRPRRPEGSREPEKMRNRNDVNVYAMHHVSGQEGFKDKSSKKPEPVRTEAFREDERDSRNRERERRRKPRRRLEYDDDDDDCDDDEDCPYENRRSRGRR